MPRSFRQAAQKMPLPSYKPENISRVAIFGTMEQGNLLNSSIPFPDYSAHMGNISSGGFPKGVNQMFDLIKGTEIF